MIRMMRVFVQESYSWSISMTCRTLDILNWYPRKLFHSPVNSYETCHLVDATEDNDGGFAQFVVELARGGFRAWRTWRSFVVLVLIQLYITQITQELPSDEHITWKWMAWSLGRLFSSTNKG